MTVVKEELKEAPEMLKNTGVRILPTASCYFRVPCGINDAPNSG